MAKNLKDLKQIEKDFDQISRAKAGIEQLEQLVNSILDEYKEAMISEGVKDISSESGTVTYVAATKITTYNYVKLLKDKAIPDSELAPYVKTSNRKEHVKFSEAKSKRR